jgi:hypothetical protein
MSIHMLQLFQGSPTDVRQLNTFPTHHCALLCPAWKSSTTESYSCVSPLDLGEHSPAHPPLISRVLYQRALDPTLPLSNTVGGDVCTVIVGAMVHAQST